MKGTDYRNASYRRLYTEDNAAWDAMGWKANTTFFFILGRMDRSGIIKLHGENPVDVLNRAFPLPKKIITKGLEELIKREWVVHKEDSLFMPYLVEAESAKRSKYNRSISYRKEKEKQGGSLVYYMLDEESGHVKIGYSVCVIERKIAIEKNTDKNLYIICLMPGGRNKESKEHKRWKNKRVTGEWFKFDSEIENYLRNFRGLIATDSLFEGVIGASA